MTVVSAGRQYASYCDKPDEPAGTLYIPIVPNDGPLSLGGGVTYVPYGASSTKAAIARSLYVGTAGNLELTAANECVASGLAYGAVASNEIAIAGHRFATGDRVMIAGAGIPTNLAAQTAYFVIVVDANTIQLATTVANAQAGTNGTLTAAGSGSFSVFKTTLFANVNAGVIPLCVSQVNAASTASNINAMV